MAKRYVFSFGDYEQAEEAAGPDGVKSLLGGKGGNLAEIAKEGIPIPKGFTISTEACRDYYKQDPPALPETLWDEIVEYIKKLEEETDKRFNDDEKPLLVSCRSGAAISMPGMMDTVLNIGLNDKTAATMVTLTENPRFVWDSYRRLLQGYGSIVLNIPDEKFEEALKQMKQEKNVNLDTEVEAEDWEKLVTTYKEIIETEKGEPFPQEPLDQVKGAVQAVLQSWNSERAIDYRNNLNISHDLGTAVNIMMMVFGNMGDTSATGVAFTRNPSTGEQSLFGDYLINAQGEDIVAGIRTPTPIAQMEAVFPQVFEKFNEIIKQLENHFKDMQDIEFTIENGELWILQTRNGKRTARATIKIAHDMATEGIIAKDEAVSRVTTDHLETMLHPQFAPEDLKASADKRFASGINASPGAAIGQVYFTADKAKEMAKQGQDVIMIRQFTKPDDFGGMIVSKGCFTAEGGASSHAAVVARQMGIPAVVGCGELQIDFNELTVTNGSATVREGDWVSIDGTTGTVYLGQLPMVKPNIEEQTELMTLLTWADEIRSAEGSRESVNHGPNRGLQIWANADSGDDATKARQFGAEGIGLCRTEHMFLGDRAEMVQRLILSTDEEDRDGALQELEELQTADFASIFEVMSGFPAIIRLIDPPLHEFLPNVLEAIEELAYMKAKKEFPEGGVEEEDINEKEKQVNKLKELHEDNPMIGFRGVRLVLLIPGLLKMQLRAIIEGACQAAERGAQPMPEIMVPLTCSEMELAKIKPEIESVANAVFKEHEVNFPIKFGTMIEVPRAALIADKMAKYAEFFSFGTNDLNQMSFGYSRDDAEVKFLQQYREWEIFKDSPFQTIDTEGVGQLMEIAVKGGRSTNKELVIGVCGEHGGDPRSVQFCHNLGMNYVSCSPYRVPIARLAAAHAVLAERKPE